MSTFFKTTPLKTILLLSFLTLFPACRSTKKESDVVRLAYLQSDLHHLPAFVALEKGFYKEEGVLVEVAGIFKAGPELMSGFAAGSLDAGYVGLSPAIVAVANKTARVKVIAQVNKNGSALVVRKNTTNQDITTLKGKVIAIPGHSTIQDFLLRKALSDSGLNNNLTTIITIKPPEMISTLSSNNIDAFIAWEPYPSMAITRGFGKIMIYSKYIWQNHPCCVLVVSNEFLMKNPSKVNLLYNAHLKSINYIKNNLDDAVNIGVKYTGMDKNTIELALNNIQFDNHINTIKTIEYVQFLNKLGYTSIIDPRSFVKSFILNTPLPLNPIPPGERKTNQ